MIVFSLKICLSLCLIGLTFSFGEIIQQQKNCPVRPATDLRGPPRKPGNKGK